VPEIYLSVLLVVSCVEVEGVLPVRKSLKPILCI
jgi:hypothetical protein